MGVEDAPTGAPSGDVPQAAASKVARTSAGGDDATPAEGSNGNAAAAAVPAGPQEGDCLVYVSPVSCNISVV
jgi:hypothetical protein